MIKMRSRKPILLIEDDYVDVLTVKRALKEINVQNELVVAENGEKALEYLDDPEN
ncbi:MAG: chemotaxis protein CheY [Clostridia bacterium]|nr:chemotaxis protein CheY [Clostridia bacterium]